MFLLLEEQNHLEVRNFRIVIAESKKILIKDPNNSFVHNLCGLALQGNANFAASIMHFQRAIELEPTNIAAKNNLANSYKALGKLDLAENLYKSILKEKPNYVQALNNLANLKKSIYDFTSAINYFEKALKILNNNQNILINLAELYSAIGNFDKAIEILNKNLSSNPKHTSSHKFLSSLINYKNDENKEHLNKMLSLLKDKTFYNDQKMNLSFAIAKSYEDLGNYEKSFEYLNKGNELKKESLNYKIQKDEKLFDSIKNVFKDFEFNKKKLKLNKKKIIFICGMPRSGTTLVEQIVASHKEVTGSGELSYLRNVITKNFIEDNELIKNKIINEINSGNEIVSKEYYEMLGYHNIQTQTITDKAPLNFRWMGFMKIFFPECKIIHCTRNAKDNCLSLFKNYFPSNEINWSYDQKDLGKYYNLYLDLVSFWNSKLGDFVFEANYEKMINNQEEEIKKMIKFCDLDWDNNCLHYYKNKKTPIRTVSVTQARKPMVSTSINSNTKYSKYMKDLFSYLD